MTTTTIPHQANGEPVDVDATEAAAWVEVNAIEAAPTPAPGRKSRKQLDQGLRGHKRMAHRFALHFTGRFIHTPGRGWLEFNGAYWQECGEARPWNAVHSVCREALKQLGDIDDKEERDKLFADVRFCDSERGTRGVLAFARYWPGIGKRDDELDARPELLACQNGTIDLHTGEFRAADPSDLLTLAAGAVYDPEATCPTYDALMKTYQPDAEIRDYLHRLAGAALEGRQNLQNLITWYGATGGNGKGTTMRAWQHVFGTYAKVLPVEALIARKGQDQYRDEKARLKGARLILATEPGEGARFDTGTVKALTGGDRVSARAVYKAAVEFEPTWLIIMSTNNRVATPDDGGMARRLKEIRWGYTVPRDAMRDDLDAILQGEASGVLNRILTGWFAFWDKGIRHPKSVEEATAEYLAEVDPIAGFLAECVKEQQGHDVASSVLYARYKVWCDEDGVFAKSQRVFSESLQRRGFTKSRITAGVVWHNIAAVGGVATVTAPF
jgi:putative DNA primase/helicase